ncbi:MAG TPA: BglII/BstYI family type II restriction endonuclease [Aggregatilineales bacterium]|nr:BglII/BstYI family type II restriction endonuclease [Aggregatilineales bacterium]
MTIFRNLGVIDAGIEIVPVRVFADAMASGNTCFEELVWYLKTRGTADIDVPVLVLGIASPPQPE